MKRVLADDELPDDVTLRCPDCKRRVRPVPLMRHATLAVTRTCRGCQTRWTVIVRPLAVSRRGIAIHQADWIERWKLTGRSK